MKKKILLIITIFALAFLFGNGIAGIIDECVNVSFNGNKLNTMNWGLSFQNEGSTPGYENGNTEKILDALKKHNAPATFFVVGNFLETNPDLIKRMADEGHNVGNHSYHHYDMSTLSNEKFTKELTDVEYKYKEITGKDLVKLYRPPQGKYSRESLSMANDSGYKTIFWSLAYVDWYDDKQPTKEEAFKKLLGRIHPGAIVLLHSTSRTNGDILDELLTKWEEMGYSFGNLSDLE